LIKVSNKKINFCFCSHGWNY